MRKKNKFHQDRRFQELAAQVNQVLINNRGLIGDQKQQVELMLSLERKFQYYIQRYAKTKTGDILWVSAYNWGSKIVIGNIARGYPLRVLYKYNKVLGRKRKTSFKQYVPKSLKVASLYLKKVILKNIILKNVILKNVILK